METFAEDNEEAMNNKVLFKPLGYNSVSPYLIVESASQTIEFLVRVFGAVDF
jgi:hypothetical protein